MAYQLHGSLFGYICRDCPRPLSGVKVRIYAPEERDLIARVAADPRYTSAEVSEKDVEARKRRLLAEGEVGEDGAFEVSFDPKSGYEGGPVDIDIRVERLPQLGEDHVLDGGPRQVHLTTLQPAWREQGDLRVAYWKYWLPARLWCRILSWYDIWVICGRVTVCDTGQAVGGVIVEARDVDWLQQDFLGSAMTDAAGGFVIYYPGSAFRKGTFLNIELTGGPDVYFTVRTTGSLVLLAEPPSRGRQPDRENVGNCFCVDLCVRDVPDVKDGIAVFTHVGKYIHAVDIESGIGQSGLTKASSPNSNDVRAFYRTMRLHGQLPKTLNGHPLEYCFEWREVDAAGNQISPWTKVLQNQIARTVIGNWSHWDGTQWHTKDYTVNGTPGPFELVASWTSDGFIKVPQESSVFSPTGHFQPNGNQIALISNALVSWGSFNMAGKAAGATSAPFGANRYFGLRMRARSNGIMQGPSAGLLDKIAVENRGYDNLQHHPAWAGYTSPAGTLAVNLLDIQELQVNGCAEVQDTLTVLVTAAHPNLGGVSLSIVGGNAASLPAGFTVPSAGLPDERFGTATNSFAVADLAPCAYIVTLSTQVMLTTGDTVPSNLVDQMAFCKAPPP